MYSQYSPSATAICTMQKEFPQKCRERACARCSCSCCQLLYARACWLSGWTIAYAWSTHRSHWVKTSAVDISRCFATCTSSKWRALPISTIEISSKPDPALCQFILTYQVLFPTWTFEGFSNHKAMLSSNLAKLERSYVLLLQSCRLVAGQMGPFVGPFTYHWKGSITS